MSWRKARDGLLVVTLLAAVLLMPPILPYFDRRETVLGMPTVVVYVFGIWLSVIVLSCWLSRRLPLVVPPAPVTPEAVLPEVTAPGTGKPDRRRVPDRDA